MGIFIQIAIRNLIQAKRRTFLLGFALGAVALLLTVLMGISQGINDKMQEVATTIMAGHVNVAGWYKARSTDAAPIVIGAGPIKKLVEENTPGLAYVIDRHRGYGRFSSDQASLEAMLVGIEVAQEEHLFRVLRMAEEREYKEGGRAEAFGDPKRLSEPRAVLLFANHAKRLGVGVGDIITLTNETFNGSRNAADLTVVAIAKDIGILSNFNIFVPKQLIFDLYQVHESSTGNTMVYLQDPEKAPEVMNHLRAVLEKAGHQVMAYDPLPFPLKFQDIAGQDWLGQKLDLTVWRDEVAFLGWILTVVRSVSIFLLSILVGIIVVGLMNSIWISVRERTQEVGTLRAIGMSRGRVRLMFLLEAFILGLVASGVGSVLGAVLAMVIESAQVPIPDEGLKTLLMSDALHLVVHPANILAAIAALSAITALSALWPASQAARLDPVKAINKVG